MPDPQWEVKLRDGRTFIVENPTQPTAEEVQAAVSAMDPTDLAQMSRPVGGGVATSGTGGPGVEVRPPGPIPNPAEFEQAAVNINLPTGDTDPRTAAKTVVSGLPAAGGTVGGVVGAIGGGTIGGELAGPGGARAGMYGGRVVGSGTGASLGEWMRQDLLRKMGEPVPEGNLDIALEGAKSAGLDAIMPGLEYGGKALYGTSMRGMAPSLLRESPQLLERGLAERIPATFGGAQRATGRSADLMQEAVAAGTTSSAQGAGGRFTGQRNYHPDPALMDRSQQMGRVSQMAESAATEAAKPPRVATNLYEAVNQAPGAKTIITAGATHGNTALMLGMASVEALQALSRNPAALSRLGITADQLAPILGSRLVTEPLRYWEMLKQLGSDNEPGK
jgi:hypothetical protein